MPVPVVVEPAAVVVVDVNVNEVHPTKFRLDYNLVISRATEALECCCSGSKLLSFCVLCGVVVLCRVLQKGDDVRLANFPSVTLCGYFPLNVNKLCSTSMLDGHQHHQRNTPVCYVASNAHRDVCTFSIVRLNFFVVWLFVLSSLLH